jgi:multidrug efflux system membrane fusion protein
MMRGSKRLHRVLLVGVLLGGAVPALAGSLQARVEWGRRLVMGTPASGVVSQVRVSPGQRVKAGQLLLRLDDDAARAAVAAARAGARHAQDLLDEAQREYDRARELYDRTVLSDHDLQVAEIGLRDAQARAGRARADLAEARRQLAYRRIKAPFDGRVVSVSAQPGQAVSGRLRPPALLVLADDRTLRLRAWVEPQVLDALVAGHAPRVRLGGRELPAKVLHPGLEGQSRDGRWLYPVTVEVRRPADLEVRSGQPGQIVWDGPADGGG